MPWLPPNTYCSLVRTMFSFRFSSFILTPLWFLPLRILPVNGKRTIDYVYMLSGALER